jgi:type II secretory pathway component GspD/PulD (secretin)
MAAALLFAAGSVLCAHAGEPDESVEGVNEPLSAGGVMGGTADETPAPMDMPGMPGMAVSGGVGQYPGPGADPSAGGTNVSASVPAVMDIKSVGPGGGRYSFELRDALIVDLFRMLSHDYKLNLLVDQGLGGLKVTASLSNVSLQEALDAIADMAGLKLEKKGAIIKVSSNIVTEIFVLKYIEAKKLLKASGSSSGASPASASPLGVMGPGSESSAAASTPKAASSIFDLLSSQGRILAGSQPNSLIVMDLPPNIEKIRKYLSVVDQRMSTRVYKLKYIRASDLVGDTKPVSPVDEKAKDDESTSSAGGTSAGVPAVAGVY